jgi:hypothetical protein
MIAARPIGLAFADHDPRPVTRAELVRLAGPTRERPVAPQILFALTERRRQGRETGTPGARVVEQVRRAGQSRPSQCRSLWALPLALTDVTRGDDSGGRRLPEQTGCPWYEDRHGEDASLQGDEEDRRPGSLPQLGAMADRFKLQTDEPQLLSCTL